MRDHKAAQKILPPPMCGVYLRRNSSTDSASSSSSRHSRAAAAAPQQPRPKRQQQAQQQHLQTVARAATKGNRINTSSGIDTMAGARTAPLLTASGLGQVLNVDMWTRKALATAELTCAKANLMLQ